MITQFLYHLALFGQAAEEAAPKMQPSPQQSIFSFVCMIFLFLIAMYLLFILPKRRQEKQMKQLFDSLKKNDKVMTSSGIIALVHSVDKEAGEVVLKVDDSNNTKIRFSIQSIYYIFPEKSDQKSDSPEKQ